MCMCSVIVPSLPFADKEETGDEDEADDGNVAPQTINTFFRAFRLLQSFLMSFVFKN